MFGRLPPLLRWLGKDSIARLERISNRLLLIRYLIYIVCFKYEIVVKHINASVCTQCTTTRYFLLLC